MQPIKDCTSPCSISHSHSPIDSTERFSPVRFEKIKSILKTSREATPPILEKKRISFSESAMVVLIPTAHEYFEVKLKDRSRLADHIWDLSHYHIETRDDYLEPIDLLHREYDRSRARDDSRYIQFFFSCVGKQTILNQPRKDTLYTYQEEQTRPLTLPHETNDPEKMLSTPGFTAFYQERLSRIRNHRASILRPYDDG